MLNTKNSVTIPDKKREGQKIDKLYECMEDSTGKYSCSKPAKQDYGCMVIPATPTSHSHRNGEFSRITIIGHIAHIIQIQYSCAKKAHRNCRQKYLDR